MATIFGTNGSETTNGTAGDDIILGWASGSSEVDDTGADLQRGGGGSDTLNGAAAMTPSTAASARTSSSARPATIC
jgi:hypothetical protein